MHNSLAQILEIIDKLNPLHAKKIRNNSRLFDEKYGAVFNPMLDKFSQVLNDSLLGLQYAVECYLRMIAGITLEQINFIRYNSYSNASYSDVEKKIYSDSEKLNSLKLGLFISELLWPQHFLVYFRFIKLFNLYGLKTEKFLDVGGSHGQYLDYVVHCTSVKNPILLFTNPLSVEMTNWFLSSSDYLMKDEKSINENIDMFDWITMGETLEHSENPGRYINITLELLKNDGYLFVTAPVNAPAIDHVYCFRNREEVLSMFQNKGLVLVDDLQVFAEESQKLKSGVASLYAPLYLGKINI
jgi:2-polyprenyl-3-methyl-5-hydroxy-6-metoxy-1,4-benzoquinol methylase